ncbi:uncharacterized protein LOC114163737 [Vigna unguiculata]|uniref:Uncharacterized protein n=1 Tax=Vigna unguiculata TaxID=3917 RepID=A0A4D6NVS7_VIGUN|nr:uncharacterized protein LOC114163737 [Vigna unguiculata]QCE16689.1 hypothetical protein DEO72_LG11g3708 [Vigna unguiculata]
MVWPLKERRGPAWKQGWTTNTLCSLSAPPLQLLAIVAIVMFLLFVPSYVNFKSTVHTATVGFHLFLLLLPLFLIVVAYAISKHGSRLVLPAPPPFLGGIRLRTDGGGFPWGVAALVVLLLVLASYLSNFRSMWSPLIWTPY